MLNSSSSKLNLKLHQKASRTKPGNFGKPWRIILTTVLIFIISQIVAAFIVELVLVIIHGGTNPSGNLLGPAPAQFFFVLLAEAGAIWLVFQVLKWRGINRKRIGLGRVPAWSDALKGLGGFIGFFVVITLINAVLAAFFPSLNSEKQNVGFNNLNGSFDYVLALLALVLLPPVGEETLVRGYLYSGLRSKWRFWPAAIITSLIFGFAHLELGSGAAVVWAAGADTFILSLVLVYLRETTGALYAGILVHSLNNLIAFGAHFHV